MLLRAPMQNLCVHHSRTRAYRGTLLIYKWRSDSEQQRISLSQRAAGTARGAPMAPPPTTRLVHSRSISGRIQPQGLSKSMGSRPTTSMGFNRGAQPSQPSQPFQPSQSSQPPQQAPRPTSAQDMNEGDDIERDEPLIKLPKRQGMFLGPVASNKAHIAQGGT